MVSFGCPEVSSAGFNHRLSDDCFEESSAFERRTLGGWS
jgi:hypothetical protein